MEILNLTPENEPNAHREDKPKLFKGEQRKLYRDEITPLTDEEKKALRATLNGSGCLLFLIVITAASVGVLFLYYGADSGTALRYSLLAVAVAAIVYLVIWRGNAVTRKELAADRKRIIIAPALEVHTDPGRSGGSSGGGGGRRAHTLIAFSTKDRLRHRVEGKVIDVEERDMVEMHLIYRPDGSTRVALEPTKAAAFKRDRMEIKDSGGQIFFRDEIVSLTDDDRKKMTLPMGFYNGCLVLFAFPLAALAIYLFFFFAGASAWRFVWGGVAAAVSAFCLLAWLALKASNKDELANNRKRVIVAPVAGLFARTMLGNPTRFYASLGNGAEISEQEISAAEFLELEAGDIVEMQISQNPGGKSSLREIAKIAHAPATTMP